MKKALFLTLDNTLICTRSGHKNSLHREDWQFIKEVVANIKGYYNKGYLICLVINQSQIADNITTDKLFHAKLALILQSLEKYLKLPTNTIIYEYCIDKESYNYLPRPGMIYNLALEYDLDIVNSVLIGNSIYDKTIAIYSGIKTYIDVTELLLDI